MPYQLLQVPYQLEPYRPAFSLTGATQPVLYVRSFIRATARHAGLLLSTTDMCLQTMPTQVYVSFPVCTHMYLCPTNCQLLATPLAVIPASRAWVAPTGPCKSFIICFTALTLFMACSNFAKQGCLQRKSGFPSLGNTKEGFTTATWVQNSSLYGSKLFLSTNKTAIHFSVACTVAQRVDLGTQQVCHAS